MKHRDPRPDRSTSQVTGPARTKTDQLARWKRASLRDEAQRAAWQLGALLRRAEHEAPEVHVKLRVAIEALQLLRARLVLEDRAAIPAGLRSRVPAPGRIASPLRGEASQGELF